MTKAHPTISELRVAIDAADEIIIRALAARFRAVESLRDMKKAENLPILDPRRESAMKRTWKESAKEHHVSESLALLMLDFILAESKRLQES